MKYEKCEKCGAHLDHGERCDCDKEKEYRAEAEHTKKDDNK